MKKLISLLLALCMLLPILAGCKQEQAPPTQQQAQVPADPTPVAAQGNRLAVAQYPQRTLFPDFSAYEHGGELDFDAYYLESEAWSKERQERRELQYEKPEAFISDTAAAFLSELGKENGVYSPVNVYLALAMLAEITDGQSRQEILTLLGCESIAALRETAGKLWLANYSDDGATTTILGSSMWLNKDVPFVQETLDTLASRYYASSFSGAMGSDEFTQMLRDWLNEQTGGLLKDEAGNITLSPQTVLALAATIYFKAKWKSGFSEDATQPQVFHAPDGDLTCDFLKKSEAMHYYWADGFAATATDFENGGKMWFFLPDEGVSTDALLADGSSLYQLLYDEYNWSDMKHLKVNLSAPKFDVSSQMDLISGLKTLGISSVFDPDASDFSPLTQAFDEIVVSQINHAARVKIDEEGCEAAAFTVIMTEATAIAPPDDEIDFTLDRPFVFAVTGLTGDVLFLGVVNRPVE